VAATCSLRRVHGCQGSSVVARAPPCTAAPHKHTTWQLAKSLTNSRPHAAQARRCSGVSRPPSVSTERLSSAVFASSRLHAPRGSSCPLSASALALMRRSRVLRKRSRAGPWEGGPGPCPPMPLLALLLKSAISLADEPGLGCCASGRACCVL
jgi:hypothetical protein